MHVWSVSTAELKNSNTQVCVAVLQPKSQMTCYIKCQFDIPTAVGEAGLSSRIVIRMTIASYPKLALRGKQLLVPKDSVLTSSLLP